MSKEAEVKSGAQSNGLLPRSIFVQESDPRQSLRDSINSILSDKFMVFLSVSLLPIILLPFVVTVPPSINDFLDICDWTIILLFVIEYTSKLYLARSRWAHFKEPWHLV